MSSSTLLGIKNSLRSIAVSHGKQGVGIDIGIDILAQAIYYSKVDVASIIFNNNLDTTVNMNSLINHSLANLFPVYRGKNAKLKVRGYFNKPGVSLKRGDKIFSGRNFNLYISSNVTSDLTSKIVLGEADELEIRNNITPVELELEVSTLYNPISELTTKSSLYVETVTHTDVSENVLIFRTIGNGSRTPIKVTKNVSEHLDTIMLKYENNKLNNYSSDPLPLLLTNQDYGIRLYPSELDINNNITKLQKLNYSTKYEFDYFKYLEYNPTYDEVKNIAINGFQFLHALNEDGTVNNKLLDFEIEPFDYRETEMDNLSYRIKTHLVQIQKMRSNTDLVDSFNKFFSGKSLGSAVKYVFEGGENRIKFYFIPNPTTTSITQEEWLDFKATKLYHITDNIVDDTSTGIKRPFLSSQVIMNLNITVYSIAPVSQATVMEAINKFNYSTNRKIYLDEISGSINEIPNVASSTVLFEYTIDGITISESIVDNSRNLVINLPEDHHIVLSPTISNKLVNTK